MSNILYYHYQRATKLLPLALTLSTPFMPVHFSKVNPAF